MSEIRVNSIVSETGTGNVAFNKGITVTGVTTATSFVGDLTGNSTTASNLTGSPNVTINNITGVAATFTGTLTYEDVTNVDATGIVTAKGGVEFGAAGVGGTITPQGNAQIVGVMTATQFIGVTTGGILSGATVGVGTTSTILDVTDGATQNRFSGILVEKAAIQAAKLADQTVDLAQGNVHYFTTNGTGATTLAIKYKGGNNVSSFMKVGDNVSVSVISKPNNAEYVNAVTVDGAAVTEEWSGGAVPAAASGSGGYTITTVNLVRIASTGTANSDYLVLCAATNYSN
tara:strand:+ start:273 stop:1136 length:864 start_codon:yes stop_codon:yes gene_type:complete